MNFVNVFDSIFEAIPKGIGLFDTKDVRIRRQEARQQVAAGQYHQSGNVDAGVQDLVAESAAASGHALGSGSAAPTAGGLLALPVMPLEMQLDLDDAATQAAMKFILNDDYVADEGEEGSGNGAGGVDGAATGAAASALPSRDDPYFGLMQADDAKVHKGVCRMFHQERGFGFIEPVLVVPKSSNAPSRFPDVYFTREDITLAAALQSEETKADDSERARRERASLNPLYALCVGELVEFKVTVNRLGKLGGEGRRLRAVEITGPSGGPVKAQNPAERSRGVVRTWFPQKQYGFIAPNAGGRDVFFHGSAVFWADAVPAAKRVVEEGFVVDYTSVAQPEGKDVRRAGGGGGDDDDRGKHVAFGVTGANFEPIDPTTVRRSENARQRREREMERKRAREEDNEGPIPKPAPGSAGMVLLSAADENESYATW